MAAKGNPYENATAKPFFKTLKRKEVYVYDHRIVEEAQANLGRFIAEVYNAKWLNSSLNCLPPTAFGAVHANTGRSSLGRCLRSGVHYTALRPRRP